MIGTQCVESKNASDPGVGIALLNSHLMDSKPMEKAETSGPAKPYNSSFLEKALASDPVVMMDEIEFRRFNTETRRSTAVGLLLNESGFTNILSASSES